MITLPNGPVQTIQVHRSADFRVAIGNRPGAPLGPMEAMTLDDIYMLDAAAPTSHLSLAARDKGGFHLIGKTPVDADQWLDLDCAITLMSPLGDRTDAFVFILRGSDGAMVQSYLLAQTPLRAQIGYALVGMNRSRAMRKFAQVGYLSFAAGTRITIGSGDQVPIEDLRPGDIVQTHDAGPMPICRIERHRVQAEGRFAPILISAGTLSNTQDLVLSPQHRLIISQPGTGRARAPLMVKARHLINGERVRQGAGRQIDMVQILVAGHHPVYAENIASEVLATTPRLRPALPPELLERLTALVPHHGRSAPRSADVQSALLERPDAIDLLRRVSMQ